VSELEPTQPTIKLTVRLPADLHQRLKVVQAYDRRSVQEVLIGMVESWVRHKENELRGERHEGD
jgi:hypothetical protein